MLAGVTQMKFMAELESLPRGLSIGPLLEGVARSLFEAVEPLDGACVDTHTAPETTSSIAPPQSSSRRSPHSTSARCPRAFNAICAERRVPSYTSRSSAVPCLVRTRRRWLCRRSRPREDQQQICFRRGAEMLSFAGPLALWEASAERRPRRTGGPRRRDPKPWGRAHEAAVLSGRRERGASLR